MESNRGTLLLVEDEEFIGLEEARALTGEGYSVTHVCSGEKAVALMNGDLGAKMDLILMDINLGAGIDGTEAAREILKDHDVALVFLSSHTDAETVAKAEKIANYGYIVKNRGNTMLFTAVGMALRLHQAHRQIEES
ncbi:MAG: response regulator [Rectinemataceae bacterium]